MKAWAAGAGWSLLPPCIPRQAWLRTPPWFVDCAAQAMRLAPAPKGSAPRWHLGGHSEGASVVLFLLDRLLAQRAADAADVKTLVLSGLPLEPFGEIVRRQLADKPDLARAVADCS